MQPPPISHSAQQTNIRQDPKITIIRHVYRAKREYQNCNLSQARVITGDQQMGDKEQDRQGEGGKDQTAGQGYRTDMNRYKYK